MMVAVSDRWCSVQANPPSMIDLLIHVLFQIDDPVGPEARHPSASDCIEGNELVARCDIEDLLDPPSSQYARPRPERRRGAASPRSPSSRRCIHSSSPVSASAATTARRDPALCTRRTHHERRRLEVVLG